MQIRNENFQYAKKLKSLHMELLKHLYKVAIANEDILVHSKDMITRKWDLLCGSSVKN